MCRFLFIASLFLGMIPSAISFAESSTEVDQLSAEEVVIQEKARKRLYPGGRDEEDLIVHPQAIVAKRKLNRREVEKEVYKQLFNEDLKSSPGSESEEDTSEED